MEPLKHFADYLHNNILYFLYYVLGFIFLCLFLFVRMFALKAQDRAIRAEENLRHFALTGKLLPASLRIGQIIALRFAADEEFVGLAVKAASENLSSKEINFFCSEKIGFGATSAKALSAHSDRIF